MKCQILLCIALDMFMLCAFPNANYIPSCTDVLHLVAPVHSECDLVSILTRVGLIYISMGDAQVRLNITKYCMLMIKYPQHLSSLPCTAEQIRDSTQYPTIPSARLHIVQGDAGIIRASGLHLGHSGVFCLRLVPMCFCHFLLS